MQPAIEKRRPKPAQLKEPGLLRLLRELNESALWVAPERRFHT